MMSLIRTIQNKDPARPTFFEVLLAYNGFHAICLHRVTHTLWKLRLKALSRMLANIGRILTGIEIHPQATIGHHVFIDHGTGVVIGQTAIIGDNVTLYHGVTLGGKGEPDVTGKRHPTIENGAIIGAGAQILGNITIAHNAKVGSNAVVTKSVCAKSTVVGNPAREITACTDTDGKAYGLPRKVQDPYAEKLEELRAEIALLKTRTTGR